MESDPNVRDILLKMYELQQKQYAEHKETMALYRQVLARQRKMTIAAGYFVVALAGLISQGLATQGFTTIGVRRAAIGIVPRGIMTITDRLHRFIPAPAFH